MQVFDNNFDPYQAMINIDTNLSNLIKAHNNLARLVEEQQQTIDILVNGMKAANTANEILMKDVLNNMSEKLKDIR
jgi:hypothetical protein